MNDNWRMNDKWSELCPRTLLHYTGIFNLEAEEFDIIDFQEIGEVCAMALNGIAESRNAFGT